MKRSGRWFQIDALNVISSDLHINNADEGISYSGNWRHSRNRKNGDFGKDVHATRQRGASFEYTFTGSGIEYIAPKHPNYNTDIEIFIDGVSYGTINTQGNNGYEAQQVVFSIDNLPQGTHTFKAVKVSGGWFQIDRLVIMP